MRRFRYRLVSLVGVVAAGLVLSGCLTINFGELDDLKVGMTLSEVQALGYVYQAAFPGVDCGDASKPGVDWNVGAHGLLAGTPLKLGAIYTRDPAYKTPSGLGVGSTLAQLRKVNGANLHEYHPGDGSNRALYQDVAVLFKDSQAISYWLNSDNTVNTVKVSLAAWAGDDEGCA